MNSDSVVKGFDVFKNQVVCVSVILNVKTVKPFSFYENNCVACFLWLHAMPVTHTDFRGRCVLLMVNQCYVLPWLFQLSLLQWKLPLCPDTHFTHVFTDGTLWNGFAGFLQKFSDFRSTVILLWIIIDFENLLLNGILAFGSSWQFAFKTCVFPLYFRFVIAWTNHGNVAVIVTVLWLPSGKGANADAQVPGTLKLCEIRMLLAIINGIQFELFGILFSWHNEYLLLVLYNIFRGISHFVLNYLYASTNIRKEDK